MIYKHLDFFVNIKESVVYEEMIGMKKWGVLFFLVVGLICIGISAVMYASEKEYEKYAVKLTGEITDVYSYIDHDGEVRSGAYVTYSYNDVIYEDVKLNYYSSNMKEGKEIELFVNKYSPRDIKTANEGMIFSGIPLLIGVVFILVGIAPLFLQAKRNGRIKKIKENSHRIMGRVVDLKVDYSLRINGKNPLKLIVEIASPVNGEITTVISEASFDFNESWIGKSVYVYINRKTMKSYVDYENAC